MVADEADEGMDVGDEVVEGPVGRGRREGTVPDSEVEMSIYSQDIKRRFREGTVPDSVQFILRRRFSFQWHHRRQAGGSEESDAGEAVIF